MPIQQRIKPLAILFEFLFPLLDVGEKAQNKMSIGLIGFAQNPE